MNYYLLDWLQQCRRAGVYEQVRAFYEGRWNVSQLTDEQQAEDNYRICAHCGSDVEAKPKRKPRKSKEGDDE
ncbi:MAG TPA: hypothetical protein VGX78_06610 [Pirellulales bacterium]|jgi:hypothetical protein|nr:hypothetical protein [Pirellulales bacterium]